MALRGIAILALLCACGGAWSQDDPRTSASGAYAIDPVHTRVVFSVSHAGFSQAVGTISGSTGTLRFDPEHWPEAQLDVTVPLQHLDLGDGKWNAAVLAPNLLDAADHPEARFVSNRVEPVDAQHARVCGELSLRGVTRPLCMDVTFNALKRHPLPPFRRTAGFSATATLSRKDFGITAWPTVIADEVSLRIEAEAVRGRPRALSAPGQPPAPGEPENAGTAPADVPGSDVPGSDVPEPDVPEPDVPEPDAPEPASPEDTPPP